MRGKSAWRDNIFVERLWRSVKYEPNKRGHLSVFGQQSGATEISRILHEFR